MILGTFLAAAIALYFGVSLLVVLVFAAIAQGAVSFLLTGNRVVIRTTVPVVLVAAIQFLVVPMLLGVASSTEASLPPAEWFSLAESVFTFLTYLIALVGLVGSTILGLLGRPRQPKSQEG